MNEQKARIAVLVSGGGTNLQALIDAQRQGKLPHGEIVLVVSNKEGAYALTRASEAGIPALTVTRKQAGGQEAFESEILRALKEYRADMVVLAGFLSILSADFVAEYPNRILNVHPSLIPAFCGEGYYGLRVHRAALERGVKVTGATVHLVNEVTDGGKILMQRAVRVRRGDTPESLQARVMREAEWKILPAATERVAKSIVKGKGN